MISDNPTHRLDLYITSGSFGNIYPRINIISGRSTKHPQSEYEPKVYEPGQWFGTVCDYNAMVLGSLDPFLEDLFNLCSHEFSLKIAAGRPLSHKCTLIFCIEYIHSHNFIHRDIKPHDLYVGIRRRGNQTNTIGLGLTNEFCDSRTCLPIPYRKNKNLARTARCTLTNSLLGVEQARHDDLGSLAHFFMYFLCGAPPWQVLHITTGGQKYGPFNYTRALRFNDNSDYHYPRKPFRDPLIHESFQYDYVPDQSIQHGCPGEGSSRVSRGVSVGRRKVVQEDYLANNGM
ncbi:kinase-like protein [Pisolithus microcarpus]|nr:kinase-like protein [Pisolithus microcarpus]